MRKLRQLSLAVVLTFAFATCGFAGIIPTVPEAPPQPPSALETSTGITDTPPAAQSEPTDPVIEFALNVLRSALSLF